jgi:hypothetical protein
MSMRYRRNPQTAGRVIDGQAFVLTPDDNRLHTLNEAATRLWELAREGCTAEQAAEALVARYEVDAETARADAASFLDDLVARRILSAE